MDNNNQYWIPAGEAVSEFTEKRSRFIGQIRPVNSEADARRFLDEIRKKHRDARHNCWCYIIQSDGMIIRCSDDGEPQGTAGQPILQVFQRREVVNLCCVVTRYFGGVLLGAGGLTRAYARAAKDVLDAAGVIRMELWTEWEVICPYAVLERVKQDAAMRGCGFKTRVSVGQRTRFYGACTGNRRDFVKIRRRIPTTGHVLIILYN